MENLLFWCHILSPLEVTRVIIIRIIRIKVKFLRGEHFIYWCVNRTYSPVLIANISAVRLVAANKASTTAMIRSSIIKCGCEIASDKYSLGLKKNIKFCNSFFCWVLNY